MKALEVPLELKIQITAFKARLGWCKCIWHLGLCLWCCTTLAQCLPAYYTDKLIIYQWRTIKLRNAHNYLLGQMANANQTQVFHMPSSDTVDKSGKLVILRSSGNEKSCIIVIVEITAGCRRVQPYVILKRKCFQRNSYQLWLFSEQRKRGRWLTSDLLADWHV